MKKLSIISFFLIFSYGHVAMASVKPERIDQEFLYLQGGIETVLGVQQSGPTIDLGAGIRVNGKTTYKNGYGGSLLIGKQWIRERKDEEPQYHRGELELVTVKIPLKSMTFLTSLPSSEAIRINSIFANYLYRIHATKDYRFSIGGGIGLSKLDIPDGPQITPDCSCPQGGSGSGISYQIKATVQRQYRSDLLFQGHIAHRAYPGSTQGIAPSTEYKRLTQSSIGISFQYIFD